MINARYSPVMLFRLVTNLLLSLVGNLAKRYMWTKLALFRLAVKLWRSSIIEDFNVLILFCDKIFIILLKNNLLEYCCFFPPMFWNYSLTHHLPDANWNFWLTKTQIEHLHVNHHNFATNFKAILPWIASNLCHYLQYANWTGFNWELTWSLNLKLACNLAVHLTLSFLTLAFHQLVVSNMNVPTCDHYCAITCHLALRYVVLGAC